MIADLFDISVAVSREWSETDNATDEAKLLISKIDTIMEYCINEFEQTNSPYIQVLKNEIEMRDREIKTVVEGCTVLSDRLRNYHNADWRTRLKYLFFKTSI